MWYEWTLVACLYQASLDRKGKQNESHVLEQTNTEANNAMIIDNFNHPISVKDLDVSDFFEYPSGDIRHLIGGGV